MYHAGGNHREQPPTLKQREQGTSLEFLKLRSLEEQPMELKFRPLKQGHRLTGTRIFELGGEPQSLRVILEEGDECSGWFCKY